MLTHLLGIVLANAQCNIFEEVKAFVMEDRAMSAAASRAA